MVRTLKHTKKLSISQMMIEYSIFSLQILLPDLLVDDLNMEDHAGVLGSSSSLEIMFMLSKSYLSSIFYGAEIMLELDVVRMNLVGCGWSI